MERRRLPPWLKTDMPAGYKYSKLKQILKSYRLHTICESGKCPNIGNCWRKGTATFMILGDICTRNCKFCDVKHGHPYPPDYDEPERIANAVKLMNLNHCVLTSVTRDDLSDLGANIWIQTITMVKQRNPEITIEALIPDFNADKKFLNKIIVAAPDIVSHNLETVKRLTPLIRSKADYNTSLAVLKYLSGSGIITKSGIMLGLGEREEEIYQTMDDLIDAGCQIFTIGQYLQPKTSDFKVQEYIRPEKFIQYKEIGLRKGFKYVESGPLVRSSYCSEEQLLALREL